MGASSENGSREQKVDDAILLTLATAAAFVIGYSYYEAYFGTFGIPRREIWLRTEIYLREGAVKALLATSFFLLVYAVDRFTSNDASKRVVARGGVLVLSSMAFFLLLAFLRTSPAFSQPPWRQILTVGGFLLAFHGTVWALSALPGLGDPEQSFHARLFRGTLRERAGTLLLGVVLVAAFSAGMGHLRAREMVENDSFGLNKHVALRLEDERSPINGVPLLYVAHSDGQYYLYDDLRMTPQRLYVVPDAEVSGVILMTSIELQSYTTQGQENG